MQSITKSIDVPVQRFDELVSVDQLIEPEKSENQNDAIEQAKAHIEKIVSSQLAFLGTDYQELKDYLFNQITNTLNLNQLEIDFPRDQVTQNIANFKGKLTSVAGILDDKSTELWKWIRYIEYLRKVKTDFDQEKADLSSSIHNGSLKIVDYNKVITEQEGIDLKTIPSHEAGRVRMKINAYKATLAKKEQEIENKKTRFKSLINVDPLEEFKGKIDEEFAIVIENYKDKFPRIKEINGSWNSLEKDFKYSVEVLRDKEEIVEKESLWQKELFNIGNIVVSTRKLAGLVLLGTVLIAGVSVFAYVDKKQDNFNLVYDQNLKNIPFSIQKEVSQLHDLKFTEVIKILGGTNDLNGRRAYFDVDWGKLPKGSDSIKVEFLKNGKVVSSAVDGQNNIAFPLSSDSGQEEIGAIITLTWDINGSKFQAKTNEMTTIITTKAKKMSTGDGQNADIVSSDTALEIDDLESDLDKIDELNEEAGALLDQAKKIKDKQKDVKSESTIFKP